MDFCSVSLNDSRAAHTAAYAKRSKALLGVSLLHLIDERYENTSAGAAYGVSESDRAAIDIELIHIK